MPGVTDATVRPLSVHVCEITFIDQPNAGGRAAGTLINMLLINPCVCVGCKTSARDTHIYMYAHLSDTIHTHSEFSDVLHTTLYGLIVSFMYVCGMQQL